MCRGAIERLVAGQEDVSTVCRCLELLGLMVIASLIVVTDTIHYSYNMLSALI